MRNTWAAYLVDIATGKIEWTLGGKRSSFKFGPGADFQWQHDVALAPGSSAGAPRSRITMFDDHCCQLTGGGTSVPGDRTLARAGARARPAGAHGDARRPVPVGRRIRNRIHGRHAAAGQRQRVRRLGLGALLLGVHPLRAAAAGGQLPRLRPELPRDARAVGRPAAHPARRRRPPAGQPGHGVRELERRHPGRLLAGAGRVRRRPADRRGKRRQVRV